MQGRELIQHAFGEKIILNDIWFQEETCKILVSALTAKETLELDMDLLACVCHKRKE